MPTCLLCEQPFPNSIIIDGKRRILASRSYCLKCSPFGERSRERKYKPPKKLCRVCGKNLPLRGPRCGTCQTKVRRYRVKQAAVEFLGGKCVRCGWKGDIAGFQFHHRDPAKKEFVVARVAHRSWAQVKKELAKCDLLCAICHSVEHADRSPAFMAEVAKYQGQTFDLHP